MTIQWTQPTVPDGYRVGPYSNFYQALRDNPGEWAEYPGHFVQGMQFASRHPEDFEAKTETVHKDNGKERRTLIRYIGE